MTAARINVPAIPTPRSFQAETQSEGEPAPQAIYERSMARFDEMYDEWIKALYAIRDA
jgi:hypothetical protein